MLEPSESIQVPIYYAGWQQPYDLSYPVFEPEVAVELTTDTTPIPWSQLQADFRPPNGIFSASGLRTVRRCGWRPVLWSQWGRDWDAGATPGSIAHRSTAQHHLM